MYKKNYILWLTVFVLSEKLQYPKHDVYKRTHAVVCQMILTLMFPSSFLPNYVSHKDTYQQKAFCGVYSENGNMFLSACQGK